MFTVLFLTRYSGTEAAGESSPPSRSLTGPAGPWRSVCAPRNLHRHSSADRLLKGDQSCGSILFWRHGNQASPAAGVHSRGPHAGAHFSPWNSSKIAHCLRATAPAASKTLSPTSTPPTRAGGANTITLAAPTTSPYILTTGQLGIAANDNLTILGNGDTIERSTATGTPAFRLLFVAPGASLTLQNPDAATRPGVGFGRVGGGRGDL